MASTNLLYDLSFLGDGRVSGVERFSIEIYKNLANTERRKIFALLPKGYDEKQINNKVCNLFLPFNNKMLNHLFMFYVLLFRKFDHVFLPAFPPFFLFYMFCKLKNVKLVRVIHDVVYWQEKTGLSFKSKFYLKPLENWMLYRYEKIITVSKYSARKIKEVLGVDGVGVCPNGVASVFQPLKIDRNRNVIKLISVGTIEPRKNYPFLIDVLSELIESGVDAELQIMGRAGWGYDDLINKIESSPHSKKIKIACNLSDEQLNIEYCKSTVFLFPSFEEGFGIPIIEAMQNGLPVIAANNSAITEVVEDYGILIDGYNAVQWAEKITDLVYSDDMYSTMMKQSYLRASDYSWSNSADILMRLIYEK